jgi:hypothetical protein
MVRALGLRAVTLPHSHGNVKGWRVASSVRQDLRNVGFLVGNVQSNMVSDDVLVGLNAAVCQAGAKLWVVKSAPNRSIELLPSKWGCPARAQGEAGSACARLHPKRSSLCTHQRQLDVRVDDASTQAKWRIGRAALDALQEEMSDETGQRIYYDSRELMETIDVGLQWSPEYHPIHGSTEALRNRPPTRLNWWFSHHLPVVSAPMQSYVEVASRVGYPSSLVNISSGATLTEALCAIRPQEERACLQNLAADASRSASPQQSAIDLLRAVCDVSQDVRQDVSQDLATRTTSAGQDVGHEVRQGAGHEAAHQTAGDGAHLASTSAHKDLGDGQNVIVDDD